jgi:pre-mRNA-splicing factor SYF1
MDLQSSSPRQYLQTIADAISQIDPQKAENGNLSEIWIRFANFYVENGDLKNTNLVFDRATKINYKSQEDTIKIWIAWAETLIEANFPKDALTVVKNALFNRKKSDEKINFEGFNVQLWSLYLDLESNLGTFETLSEAYKRVINLKVVTPYMLINYTSLLEKHRFFEESFKIFETGISLFEWPGCYEIWILYLNKFINRYKGSKLERCRDLFEKVLEKVPKNVNKIYFFLKKLNFLNKKS